MPSFTIALLATLLASTATAPYQADAPVLWPVSVGGNGHYYQTVIAPAGVDWETANTYATKHGGYLATITSTAENAFVFHLIDNPNYWVNNANSNGPWLGGWKSPLATLPQDGWQWVNHEGPFDYTNWGQGQPDNTGGIENRIHYFVFGQNLRGPDWNDGPDTYLNRSFVIEYETDPAPVPPSPKSPPLLPVFASLMAAYLF